MVSVEEEDGLLPGLDAEVVLDERTTIDPRPAGSRFADGSVDIEKAEPAPGPVPDRDPVPARARARVRAPATGDGHPVPAPAPARVPVPAQAPVPSNASGEATTPQRSGDSPERLGASASELLGASAATQASSSARAAYRPYRTLAEVWPEPPRRRRIPTKLRAALIAAIALLVAIVAFGNRGSRPPAAAVSAIQDDMVVSADELRNRREVRADDFRPRGGAPVRLSAPSPAQASAPAETSTATLAERRARRAKDPEDVLTLREKREAKTAAATGAPVDDEPIYVTASGAAPGKDGASTTPADARTGKALAAAGTSIAAVLVTPVELAGGSGTVVARAVSGPLQGARFVGTGSASAGRVSLRFHAALLADGRKARVEGEAQDADGAFGLRVDGETTPDEDQKGSVLGEVAEETATDLVSDTIGIGVAGRAVNRYVAGSRGRRPNRPTRTVSLAAGTRLQIFLHETVEVRE